MNEVDVLVVGGGPAGSSVAAVLADAGYHIVVLDRATFPRSKACAEYCSPGVEDVLREAGMWDGVERLGPRRLAGMRLLGPKGSGFRVEYQTASGARTAFALPRTELDHALMRNAERRGADVWEGWRVVRVDRDRRYMTAIATDRAGERRCVRARVVVGADGMHSLVARSIGASVRSHWPCRLGLVAHYEGMDDFGEWGEMHTGTGLYCGLAPLPHGKLNVGLVVALTAGKRGRRSVDTLFQDAIDSLPGVSRRLCRARRISPIRGMGPMTRRVNPVAGRGYLLVGDAAGFLDPFTGEGIYRALRGGQIAAHVIRTALDRPAESDGPPDLTEYVALRRSEFGAKEALTWVIQLGLANPTIFDYLCCNVRRHERERVMLGAVLGDCAPAAGLFRPDRLAALFLPW